MPYLGTLIRHHLLQHQITSLLYIGQAWPLLDSSIGDFSKLTFRRCEAHELQNISKNQRVDLVIARSHTESPKNELLNALGLAKNLLSEKIWFYDESEIFEFSELIAMGFKRDVEASEDFHNVFSYNLQNYNKKRDWNNSKNWANPHRWHIRF